MRTSVLSDEFLERSACALARSSVEFSRSVGKPVQVYPYAKTVEQINKKYGLKLTLGLSSRPKVDLPTTEHLLDEIRRKNSTQPAPMKTPMKLEQTSHVLVHPSSPSLTQKPRPCTLRRTPQ